MKNSRKRINIIDLIFLVLLIIVVAFGVFKLSDVKNYTDDSTATKVSYVVEVKNQDTDILEHINIDDKVFEDESLKRMGKVTDVSYKPYEIQTEDSENKRMLMQKVPDKISAYIKIEADGIKSNNAVSVDSINILVGKTIDLNIGDSYVEGVIVEVQDINEAKEMQAE